MSHLLVLGGSGRTGRLVIAEALRRGHTVTALVRDASKMVPGEHLTVVEGSPLRPESVDAACRGAQAVIIALANRGLSDAPWSGQLSPPDLITDAVQAAADAMRSRGIRRIVLLSALGTADSSESVPWGLRWSTHFMRMATVYRDHAAADAELRSSGLDWTIVRPTLLSNTSKRRPITTTKAGRTPHSLHIGRADVAGYLVDAIEDDSLIGTAPIISSGGRA